LFNDGCLHRCGVLPSGSDAAQHNDCQKKNRSNRNPDFFAFGHIKFASFSGIFIKIYRIFAEPDKLPNY